MWPFAQQLEKLATLCVRDKKEAEANLLDERLMGTPALAVERADEVTRMMAQTACQSLQEALSLLDAYDGKKAEKVREMEEKVDSYEDKIGTYLVHVSALNLDEPDAREITKLLHLIGDFERISDHAVNFVESAEEIRDKKLPFTPEARHEIETITSAVQEILSMAYDCFIHNDLREAALVEPLEQVVDLLRDKIRLNHVLRLQKSECTIEQGFVLSDLLTNFERVSDHCSNIAGCILELSQHDALDMHQYLDTVKRGSREFEAAFEGYLKKYSLPEQRP